MTALATEFERAEDSPGLLLWRLSNKWQAQQRAALKSFNLTHAQFVLLATLTYAAKELTQRQLAEYAATDVMMTSQLVRKLEQKGLVKRDSSKLDGRANTLRPTQAGVELVNQAVKAVESVDREFFSVAGEELPRFIQVMQQLANSSSRRR